MVMLSILIILVIVTHQRWKPIEFFDSGSIVELLSENLTVYQYKNAACMIVKVRYSGNPQPNVRASFFLEKYSVTHLLYGAFREKPLQDFFVLT